MLFKEPKLLKPALLKHGNQVVVEISVLFNEPKLLKLVRFEFQCRNQYDFSALQRAEIAEITAPAIAGKYGSNFSALQRAEIAESKREPAVLLIGQYFSALQRAEIAETFRRPGIRCVPDVFQCSSTSRNC